EMQVSGYTQKEQLRFQQYGYRLVGRQLKQGDEYTELKPFYQIIFMNDKPRDGGRMIRHYKVKDEDNQEEPNGTLNRAIVFLPMIKQRVKEVGGVENLTEFETFCYVLAYNPDDAILNMKRRMVNVVMEKYNEMREDGSLFSWAESVEFAEQAVQANLEERTAEAEKLGLEKGLKKGLEKGLVKGKRTMLKALLIHKY
ncbi:Rpn family recombination-promoting nuclease/putative transposase, partial [[Clostridium] innocuum]|nr:Rpn family recombination-promoting nuclease/putative transposase [[Clostridium] innocuum]